MIHKRQQLSESIKLLPIAAIRNRNVFSVRKDWSHGSINDRSLNYLIQPQNPHTDRLSLMTPPCGGRTVVGFMVVASNVKQEECHHCFQERN